MQVAIDFNLLNGDFPRLNTGIFEWTNPMFARRTFIGVVMSSLYASLFESPWLNAEWKEKKYYVGISESLIMGKPNEDLKESMSNIFEIPERPKCQFEFGPLFNIAKRLQDEHIDLCVLNGIEYAWIKASFPDLIPLVTSYTTDVKMKACVIVTVENSARTLLDLKGKSISLSERLPHHTHTFTCSTQLKSKVASQKDSSIAHLYHQIQMKV